MQIREKSVPGYERVVLAREDSIGYSGIIAVHSTKLGPATGGTRFWNYKSEDEALTDVLRLARGMTYKNALAELPIGGGKSIVIGDNKRTDRERIFRAHGQLVEKLGGQYITAEDVGTGTADMEFVRMETKHVAGLQGKSGDPSPRTGRGVFRAMQAAAKFRWGNDDLAGKTVAIQGCGHVGYYLGGELHRAGAKLIVADVDAEKTKRMAAEYGATVVGTAEIAAFKADIFAPCALGGIINDQTIPQFKVEMVVGAANNQLLESRHGEMIEKRGLLYAPDYAANAGGIISGCCVEMLGWETERMLKKVDAIYDTMLKIFSLAKKEGVPAYLAADRLAEQILARA